MFIGDFNNIDYMHWTRFRNRIAYQAHYDIVMTFYDFFEGFA